MYQEYINYLSSQTQKDVMMLNFKSHNKYTSILEHVSKEQGKKYIELIQTMFSDITIENIKNFVKINDEYGKPCKEFFILSDNDAIECSPTSLRYIFHAIIILKYYDNCKMHNIVEIGCGYGGLFLAINFFSNILNININTYYIIDLPKVCQLIDKYLQANKNYINIQYAIYSSDNYGSDINDSNLFMISNYCFTEIENIHREKYIENMFSKIKNGFIIWQTVFGLPISSVNIIKKDIKKIEPELPQTAPQDHPNFFVYF